MLDRSSPDVEIGAVRQEALRERSGTEYETQRPPYYTGNREQLYSGCGVQIHARSLSRNGTQLAVVTRAGGFRSNRYIVE